MQKTSQLDPEMLSYFEEFIDSAPRSRRIGQFFGFDGGVVSFQEQGFLRKELLSHRCQQLAGQREAGVWLVLLWFVF